MNTTKQVFIIVFLLLILFSSSFAQLSDNDFILGAFRNPSITNNTNLTSDTTRVRLAVNLGLNLLTYLQYSGPTTQSFNDYYLDISDKVGINYCICDTRHMISPGNSAWLSTATVTFNQTNANNVTNHYTSLSSALREHLFGYSIVDEPSPSVMNSTHLPFVQSWISHLKSQEPSKHSVVILLPMIAATSVSTDPDFQTISDYEDYLDEYLNPTNDDNKPDIAAFDVYLKNQPGGGNAQYYDNLKLFREKAKGRPMWGYVDVNQASGTVNAFVNPQGGNFNPDESYISWSINNYLAYGFKGIIYFPYDYSGSASNIGLVNGTTIDHSKYDVALDMNSFIKDVVADVIMNSEYMGTFHKENLVDVDGTTIETIDSDQKVSVNNNPLFYDISHSKSMVGVFYNESERESYLYLVNKGFHDGFSNINVTVKLYGDKRNRISIATMDNHSYIPQSASYYGNITTFTIYNLKPGEGRMIKILDDSGFGKWDNEYTGYGNETFQPVPGDYDGDGKTDLATYYYTGLWSIDYSNNGFGHNDYFRFISSSNCTPVPADYDGDGKTDLSVKCDNGYWYINYSSDGFNDSWDVTRTGCGDATNHPVPADYDGDGKADISIKNDAGYWKIDYAQGGFGSWNLTVSQYGASDAHPVPADYNGDGKADLSIKADWGSWYINYSNDGFYDGWDKIVTGYGDATNHPVPGDYDGDGKADLSIKNDNGDWKIDYAANGFNGFEETNILYGGSSALPVPADYDGDGINDLSVKTSTGNWYIDYAGYSEDYLTKQSTNNHESEKIEIAKEETVPLVFEIGNYPNPFNPITNINFSLPFNTNVQIEVFDILGRKIASLLDEYKNAGKYTITFDASKLSSGTYVYILKTDKFVKTGKMMLIK